MRRFALLATIVALSGACQPSTPAASGHGPSPSASAPPSASATASAHPTATATSAPSSGPATLTGPYGILLRRGNLLLIKPDATVAATVDLAPPSVGLCSSAHHGAMEPPPVSAITPQVYCRACVLGRGASRPACAGWVRRAPAPARPGGAYGPPGLG